MSVLTPAMADRARAAVRPLTLGRVAELVGLHLVVTGLPAAVGDLVRIVPATATATGTGISVLAEVAASGPAGLVCLPLGPTTGLQVGAHVHHTGGPLRVHVGDELRGRVLDGLGRPIDGGPSLDHLPSVVVENRAPDALSRPRIDTQLGLGVRAMDALTPCGRGQRLGIMAGSGVGKSSLLSMIARGTDAEVSVIALVGERGRTG
jgi:flagellum-specific ATP synthase